MLLSVRLSHFERVLPHEADKHVRAAPDFNAPLGDLRVRFTAVLCVLRNGQQCNPLARLSRKQPATVGIEYVVLG